MGWWGLLNFLDFKIILLSDLLIHMRQYSQPDSTLRKKFGMRVRELRKEQGLSQEDLGFKANIHRTYIGAVERGEQNVSLDNIGRIAKHLKVTLSELFKL